MPVIQPLVPDAPDIQLCALICEYNPFHTGHAMQLAMLRQAGFEYFTFYKERQPRMLHLA